jgi:hypothetical protein
MTATKNAAAVNVKGKTTATAKFKQVAKQNKKRVIPKMKEL